MGAGGFDFEHPSQVMEEISHLIPSYSGLTYEKLDDGELPLPSGRRRKGRLTTLRYQPPEELCDEAYPLILATERGLYQFQSTMSRRVEGLNILSGKDLVEVNPADAAALGIESSERVQVISRRGRLTATARLTESSPPGLVYIAPPSCKLPTNVLTSPSAFKECAIRLEKRYNRKRRKRQDD